MPGSRQASKGAGPCLRSKLDYCHGLAWGWKEGDGRWEPGWSVELPNSFPPPSAKESRHSGPAVSHDICQSLTLTIL